MEKKIRIGILGLGIVGSKVFDLIQENKERAKKEYGIVLEIVCIMVRDRNKKRNVDTDEIWITNNINDVVKNLDIDICIECMGGVGTNKTKEAVIMALRNHKHVIMSSKKCLAMYGNEIVRAAKENNRQLRMEASVGGGIPICNTIMHMSQGESIKKIFGIVNATSNYILTSMYKYDKTYEEALKEAKENGLAENNPKEDVDGFDAAYKLCILLRLCMKLDVSIQDLQPASIKKLSAKDMKKANEDGKIIKPIFYAEMNDKEELECFVGPYAVSKENPLAFVNDNNNMIFVEGKCSGLRAFYGQGAGASPTASVIYDDLIDVILNENSCFDKQSGKIKTVRVDKIRHCESISFA